MPRNVEGVSVPKAFFGLESLGKECFFLIRVGVDGAFVALCVCVCAGSTLTIFI